VLTALTLLLSGTPAGTTAAGPVRVPPVAAPGEVSVTPTASTATLTWSAVPGANDYVIDYDTSDTFAAARQFTSGSTIAVLTGLDSETTYFVRLAARVAGIDTTGAWGPTTTFTTTGPTYALAPPKVTLSSPTSTSITAKWDEVETGVTYQVKLGRSPEELEAAKDAKDLGVTYDKLRRKTKYYVSARAVLPSGTPVTDWSDPVSTTTPESLPLGVGSYNILCANCSGGKAPWAKRREALVETIRSRDLDVLGVQEASIGGVGGGTTQYRDLITRLGGPYKLTEYGRGVSPDIRIIYNADRIELVKQDVIRLPASKRFVAWAVFEQKSTGKRFFFTNTHLDPRNTKAGRAAGKAQAKAIVAAIPRLNKDELPVISVGDYASTKWEKGGNVPYDIMQAAGYKDPLGNTFHSRGSAPGAFVEKRINTSYASLNMYQRKARNFSGWVNGSNTDYIFVTPMRVSEYEVVVKVDSSGRFVGVIPSDHNLIRATVYLP
jgi:endonuclease/exonuclease/phosphatase family metal-dependent hydrolase